VSELTGIIRQGKKTTDFVKNASQRNVWMRTAEKGWERKEQMFSHPSTSDSERVQNHTHNIISQTGKVRWMVVTIHHSPILDNKNTLAKLS